MTGIKPAIPRFGSLVPFIIIAISIWAEIVNLDVWPNG